jgi:hypothetical protein
MKNIPDYLYLDSEDKDYIDYNTLTNIKVNPKRHCYTQIQYKRVPKKRSIEQNNSMWRWLTQIAELLNESGWTHENEMGIPMRYSKDLLHKVYLIPILETEFNIDSTKKMTTEILNYIIDSFTLFFGEKKGIKVPIFPNKQDYLNSLDAKTY